jgi:hypothetical protein
MSATTTIAAIVAALPPYPAFAAERMSYDGVTAYTDETVVCLYNFTDDGDDVIRVEVYDNDGNGDTFFAQDLTGLPVAVAAAWVAEAVRVVPPAGYYARIAQADLDRAVAARKRIADQLARADRAVQDAVDALATALANG